MLELILGDIEKNNRIIKKGYGSWRFVLSKDHSKIYLFAGVVPKKKGPGHKDVVLKYGLSKILGGGDFRYSFGDLIFDGMSGDFGIVPNSIMNNFGKIIFKGFKEKYKIKKIEVDMWYDSELKEKNSKHIEMWERLGYKFDNKKRIISD